MASLLASREEFVVCAPKKEVVVKILKDTKENYTD